MLVPGNEFFMSVLLRSIISDHVLVIFLVIAGLLARRDMHCGLAIVWQLAILSLALLQSDMYYVRCCHC